MREIKKILIMATCILLACMMISCGGSNDKQAKASQNVSLIFATQDIPGSPTYTGYMAFQQKLAELSSGTMSIEFVQMTKYGSIQEMIEACLGGAFDMTSVGYTDLDYAIEDLFILSVVARDLDHYITILDSPFGQNIQAQFYDVGVVASAPWYVGTRRTTSNIPINTLSNFEGLKFRIVANDAGEAFAQFAKQGGAELVPMGFQQLLAALRDGEIDAQENPLSTIEVAKIYEHQKYLAMTEHATACAGIFLNKAKYDQFSAEQKMWYNEAMSHGIETALAITLQNEVDLIDKLKTEYGMTVTYPNLDDIRAAMKPYYDSLVEKYGSVISELLAL